MLIHRALGLTALTGIALSSAVFAQSAHHPVLTCTPPANTTVKIGVVVSCSVSMVDNTSGQLDQTFAGSLTLSSPTDQKLTPLVLTLAAADHGKKLVPVTFGSSSANPILVVTEKPTGPAFYLASPFPVADASGKVPSPPAADPKDSTILQLSCAQSGLQADCTLRAFDASNGAPAPGYTGSVTFTDPSDLNAILPRGYKFKSSDNGVYQFSVTANAAGLTELLVASDGASLTYAAPWLTQTGAEPPVVDGPLYRLLGGMDLSGTASAQPAARVFLDVGAIEPLVGGNVETSPLTMWGDARLASLPHASPTAAGVFGQTSVLAPFSSADVRQFAENLTGEAGLEWAFSRPQIPQTSQHSFGLMFLSGISTPITQDQLGSVPVYATSSDLLTSLRNAGILTTAQNPLDIAFVPQSRNLMYFEYAAGFRFLWFTHMALYPGQIDLTFGQNEALSGGKLHGVIAHPSFSVPIKANTGNLGFYLFGEAYLHVARPSISNSIVLPAAAGTMASIASSVMQIPTAPPFADFIRIGIGFDLGALIKGHP